ncbi:MAG: NADH-quinone oxidoreductase subunit NuoE [Candidatus Delongbacteria bacterium]|nr:NADH-quinone oxidoreductase subunit NuoE [Candidatus Delongbacteria bacterium]
MRIKRKNPSRFSTLPDEPVDLNLLDELLEKYAGKQGSMISLLQGTQEIYGYVPKSAISKISQKANLSESDIFGVVTFYSQFRINPVGKYIIKVCHGTACHVQNAPDITYALMTELNVEDGATTDDRLFTLESVSCLGCCGLAPVITVNEDVHGKLKRSDIPKIIKHYKSLEGI